MIKLPHWLRCDWSVWGEPREWKFIHVGLFGERWQATHTIQRRVCHSCKKVQIRRVDPTPRRIA